MDPLLICELMDRNPEWEVIPLPEQDGVFVGNYKAFLRLIENTPLSEEY